MVMPVAWVERFGDAGVIPGDLSLPGVALPHGRHPTWPFHLAGKELVIDLSQPAQSIWSVIGGHVFFWPICPIAGWGIGVVMNAWDAYWRHPITETDISARSNARTARAGSTGAR